MEYYYVNMLHGYSGMQNVTCGCMFTQISRMLTYFILDEADVCRQRI